MGKIDGRGPSQPTDAWVSRSQRYSCFPAPARFRCGRHRAGAVRGATPSPPAAGEPGCDSEACSPNRWKPSGHWPAGHRYTRATGDKLPRIRRERVRQIESATPKKTASAERRAAVRLLRVVRRSASAIENRRRPSGRLLDSLTHGRVAAAQMGPPGLLCSDADDHLARPREAVRPFEPGELARDLVPGGFSLWLGQS